MLLDASDLGLRQTTAVAVPAASAPSPGTAVAVPTRRRSVAKSVQRGLLFFDLETIPDYSRSDQFDLEPLPTLPPVDGPDGLMSPEEFISQTVPAMEAWFARHNPPAEWMQAVREAEAAGKKRKGAVDAFDDHEKRIRGIEGAAAARRKDMSTCPEMCRIVAFGWKLAGDAATQSLVVGGNGAGNVSEEEILERFWGLVSGASKVIGFNILGFDLPVIFVRSILLGVVPSRSFDLKPWGSDCVDLMAARYPKSQARGLKWIAKAMGVPIPAGDVDGSQVEELYESDPTKVGEYVRSDVDIAEAIYERYRGFFC